MTHDRPCDACVAAADDPLSALYRSDCPNCRARMIARGPQFAQARKTGRLTREYLALLAAAQVTHEMVKAQAQAMGI